MAASGGFSGPVVLLAPSFSRADEALAIRIPERLSRVLGDLPFAVMRIVMRFAVKGSPLPPERTKVLVARAAEERPVGHAPRDLCATSRTSIATGRSSSASALPRCRRGWSMARAATGE